ncbi:MAG: hypothetical protein WCA84_07025 [Ignavibacteriaceae bacterium]
MENSFLKNNLNKEVNIKECKIREIQSGQRIICLSNKPTCPHFLQFGNDKFCQYILLKEIVKKKYKSEYYTG